jgi:hypothetical protein
MTRRRGTKLKDVISDVLWKWKVDDPKGEIARAISQAVSMHKEAGFKGLLRRDRKAAGQLSLAVVTDEKGE